MSEANDSIQHLFLRMSHYIYILLLLFQLIANYSFGQIPHYIITLLSQPSYICMADTEYRE